MPCTMTGSIEGDHALAEVESREEATKVTQMLCKLCKKLDKDFDGFIFPKDVEKWWKEHEEVDRREEQFRIRQSALKKLTRAERIVLGV